MSGRGSSGARTHHRCEPVFTLPDLAAGDVRGPASERVPSAPRPHAPDTGTHTSRSAPHKTGVRCGAVGRRRVTPSSAVTPRSVDGGDGRCVRHPRFPPSRGWRRPCRATEPTCCGRYGVSRHSVYAGQGGALAGHGSTDHRSSSVSDRRPPRHRARGDPRPRLRGPGPHRVPASQRTAGRGEGPRRSSVGGVAWRQGARLRGGVSAWREDARNPGSRCTWGAVRSFARLGHAPAVRGPWRRTDLSPVGPAPAASPKGSPRRRPGRRPADGSCDTGRSPRG